MIHGVKAGAAMALAFCAAAPALVAGVERPTPIPTPYLKAGPRPFFLELDGRHYLVDTTLDPFLFTQGNIVAAPGVLMANCRRRDGLPQTGSAWALFYGDGLNVVFQLQSVALRLPRQDDSPVVFSIVTTPGYDCDGAVPAPIDPADRIFHDGLEGP